MAQEPAPDPDAALMLRARRGDVQAFGELVDRWRRPVIHFIFRQLPDLDEAEDLAQAVFVQVWRSASRYQPTARFSTFLFTVARHLTLNEIRRRSRHPSESLDALTEPSETGAARDWEDGRSVPADVGAQGSELVQKVDEALADLPENQRIALSLCRDGGLSYEAIATVLDTTVPATKSLIHRARETLKARLKPYLRSGTWPEH